jgi:hypothetical protein
MNVLNLPDTGVTDCYDKQGRDIPVPKHGEPFYGQNGCVAIHPMRFQKLGPGGGSLPDTATWQDGHRAVLDRNTGLTWEIKSPAAGDVNFCDDTYSWAEAQQTYIERLNRSKYGGFTDWRMPNKDELRSILDYGRSNPAVDTWYFPHCKNEFYWARNTFEMDPNCGWVLFFGLGSATACGKTIRQFVRAVRGGYNPAFGEPDASRFSDNGDGTVTDTVTRLMWHKGENERMSWFDALEASRKLTLGGHSDWRLPNIKELNTILNLRYTGGWWYFKDVFPAAGLVPPLLHYFSSTPFEKFYVWVTNFCFGYDGYYASKEAKLLFRAVRHMDAGVETAPAFHLPDSGQRECYDDEARVIPPPTPGQPFHGQDGTVRCHPLSCTRLRQSGAPTEATATWDQGFRMVLDNNTGLLWEVKSPRPQDLNAASRQYTFDQALRFVEAMNADAYGGFTDWRLPNSEELRTIVDYGQYSPALVETFGRDCPPAFFWSRDPFGPNPDLIWGVYFSYGCRICYPKWNRYAVRLVRGGYNPAFGDPARRALKDNGDGTVSDLNAALMWMKDETPELNWDGAMKYCAGLTLGGHTDWRLPSIKEVGTLIDISFKDQCWFDKAFFPGTKTKPLGFYWATTTYAATFAWGVNFQFGYDGYYAGKKTGKYPFRPVRAL